MAGSYNKAKLARVVDPSPLLFVLSTESESAPAIIAAKIRPTLLHLLADNRLWCVIRSKVPITDVSDYNDHVSDGLYQLLVSTANGNVWMVTLPGKHRLAFGCVVTELILERSCDQMDDGNVQWIYRLPGVQSLFYSPAGHKMPSFMLLRSLVTPSTLLVSTCEKLQRELQSHQSLELDEMEGEQATCILCLNRQTASHSELFRTLFPNVANDFEVAAILQGDLDGCVRFSLVRFSSLQEDCAKAFVMRNGILFQLGEAVQMIIPFFSSVPRTFSFEKGDATESSQVFTALLVLGVRGRMGLIDLSESGSFETFPIAMKTLELGHSVQSMEFVRELAVFIFSSKGSAFVCRSIDILAKAQLAEFKASPTLPDGCIPSTEKLPLQSGIIRLATHARRGSLSILFASGQVATIDETALQNMVISVLPLSKQENCQRSGGPATPEELASESRIRNLLHRIAQVTTKSTALRTKSKQMDDQLKTLHSALEILRAVEAAGVKSVVEFDLKATMVKTGTFLSRQTIQLVCSFRFVHSDAIVSLDSWWLCLYVRAHQRVVTTYSFSLKATRGEQNIILDPDTLAQQDQGSLWASCSMVFCPSLEKLTNDEYLRTSLVDPQTLQHEKPFAFAIPLLQNQRILFAQLCQPIVEETLASQVAIHAAFRQQHVPCLPFGRANTEEKTKTQVSVLWAGMQWWAALADYALKTPTFAALWPKCLFPQVALSPPSRFVVSIPSFFGTEGDDDEDDEEFENFDKICIEKMVSFLRELLDTPVHDVPRLRRSCRSQHGKLWTLLRAFSGSLILLRFTPSEDERRSVDLTIQCSDVADLSAMRALVLSAIDKWSDGDLSEINEVDCSDKIPLDSSEMVEPIAVLENILKDLTLKIKRINDPSLNTCTDEVLYALTQLAHVESQTLALYWKSRVHTI